MTSTQSKNNSDLLDGIPAPTKDEFALIANNVFVLKPKQGNFDYSYHKWRDIWDDHMYLKVDGENPDAIYRAIALTIPLYLFYSNDTPPLIQYTSYVSALHPLSGDVRVHRGINITWCAAPQA